MKRIILILDFLACCYGLAGQNEAADVDVNARSEEHLSALNLADSYLFITSSANRYFQFSTSYSSLQFQGRFRDEEKPYAMQEGGGAIAGEFEVDSYLRLPTRGVAFAGAGYDYENKKNVSWNSIADYDLLYPHVMADSVGGNLRCEQYVFYGGFCHRIGRFCIGFSGNYHASHQYRQADPRPRNISTDLKYEISANYLFHRYSLGLSLTGTIYKQVTDVAFYNEAGANTSEMLMTGLGTQYGRFTGSAYTENRYKGRNAGFFFSAMPLSCHGWGFLAGYESFSIDRSLSSLNEVPITNLWIQKTAIGLSFVSGEERIRWGISADLLYEYRQGTENVIDNGLLNEYSILGEMTMYDSKDWKACLRWVGELKKNEWVWSLSPVVGFRNMREKYIYPKRYLSYSRFDFGVSLSLQCAMGAWWINACCEGDYVFTAGSSFGIPQCCTTAEVYQMLNYAFDRATENGFVLHPALRIQKELSRTKALFALFKYSRWFNEAMLRDSGFSISIGLCF
ncbi:MAG: hypothetical protein PUK70_00105 [Bacteroidales bacterium]|nr:hypothetical protein [Bacteroidales bacterium]MDY6002574.1 hypothetical protein [Candidatus Cryptobacteroides sp.]